MNDQANKVLLELLKKASNGIDAAVSFSQAQIPDVIHQLLLWKFTKSLIVMLIVMATIPLAAKIIRMMLKREPDGFIGDEGSSWEKGKPRFKPTLVWEKNGELSPLSIIFGAAICLYALVIFITVMDMTWLKIWLAPKLYLMEYAADLVK
jgi:hypothetical protein